MNAAFERVRMADQIKLTDTIQDVGATLVPLVVVNTRPIIDAGRMPIEFSPPKPKEIAQNSNELVIRDRADRG